MSAVLHERAAPARGGLVPLAWLSRGTLWLLAACSGIALIEPSPYELAFLLAGGVFLVVGLRFTKQVLPLLFLLLLFNLGGVFSLVPVMDEAPSVRFIAVSVYLMITCVFFVGLMAEDPLGRLETMRRGMLFAAWMAGAGGILGYFNVAGLADVFTLYGRASGTFKDPNVLGPFLVLPIVYVAMRVLTGQTGLITGGILASVPLFGLFLSFSRGGWANLAVSLLLMAGLLFLTSTSLRLRARIILSGAAGLFVLVIALLVALSFDEIRDVFQQRASLDQSYDVGVTGRFGNQLRSIPLLMESPNGFGPLRFRFLFPEDPHNVYINAFASYGWLGGFSYLALVLVTLVVGWRLVLRRAPWQRHAIVIWSVLFVTILQGMQIDTDHWRHFYLMLGVVWGLAALKPDHPLTAEAARALRRR